MKIEIKKANGSQHYCYGGMDCKKNPLYVLPSGKIKKDTIMAVVRITSPVQGYESNSKYCQQCIDDIYIKLKSAFNKNLWAFG